jgi:hypothetical protein
MTKWQEPCIEALVGGSVTFALFKAKQKDKRHINAYMRKMWPADGPDKKGAKKGNGVLSKLASTIELDTLERSPSNKTIEVFIESKGEEIDHERLESEWGILPRGYDSNSLQRIYVDGNIAMEIENGRLYVYKSLRKLGEKGLRRVAIKLHTERTGMDLIPVVAKFLRDQDNMKKGKKDPDEVAINVGIEIEYEGCSMKYATKWMKRIGAIDFHSGWDGTDSDEERDNGRLRENRLRIVGHKGLFVLEELLGEMKRKNCKMATSSGMHFHIDCRRDYREEIPKVGRLKKQVAQIEPLLDDIFETHSSRSRIENQIKLQPGFKTWEWRFGSPTLNNRILNIQILAAIHMTVRSRFDRPLNLGYLECLARLAKKENDKQKEIELKEVSFELTSWS